MAAAILNQETLKSLFNYDPDTGVFTHTKARPAVRVGSIAGTLNKILGYSIISVNGKQHYAHRLAWFYMHGTLPPKGIDHINRDRSDNRLCNLRPANQSENMQNGTQRITNTSGNVGVIWRKDIEKWQAKIRLNYKTTYLGCFNDISEAIAARKAAEQKYHTFQHGLP